MVVLGREAFMPDFEIIEHTADIGIVVRGADLAETFAAAARATFSLITDLERVQDILSREIEVTARGLELLLAEWLSELLFLFEVEHLLFCRFQVEHLDQGHLRARAYGEPFDPSRHRIHTEFKAVTHHLLSIEEGEDGYRAQVIFDI
jgi:SHS2 domain-containing protein